MIAKFARLEFELFTKPSKSDFLRLHQKKTILILDDHPMFREGFKAIIKMVKDSTSEKLLLGLE